MGAIESTGVASDAALREAEQLLFREAWLLDQHRLDEWLDLFTEDATYWVPLERGQLDPWNTSSIIFDDRTLLQIRVRQYAHPRAHARLPAARTCHQVGNVMILGSDGSELRVGSSLVLVEYRKERQRVFGASVEHRLRRTPAGLRVAAKRVDLVNSEAELDGIAFLF
jgi:3-phenylpropionate/cinnamic acid dioxygenase small subunit